ncbi:MAG TPA: flagellar basal body L-ring protein FlgH [Stenotrophobium sp.]|nr:flagellar basal body L-ring protein FlgH [Stenotrophobium sp.]
MTRHEPVASIALSFRRMVVAAALFLLGACAGSPALKDADAPPELASLPPPTPGAIFQNGQGMALFEDQKAHNIGDILTILLVENTQAKTTSSTSTAKQSDSSMSAPTIFGMPVTVHGAPVLSGALDSKHGFSGSGDSAQTNTLQGSVTVTVVGRQPNGNLVVRGMKHLDINQGSQDVRIEGIVRPADIAPDNTVQSSRVADARVAYVGTGSLAESNTKGWLARFFSSPLMPF